MSQPVVRRANYDDVLSAPANRVEPELHLGNDVLVPDLAGWRRSTMAELPDVVHFTQPLDWVAEVLSLST
jgi:hypothetical protein